MRDAAAPGGVSLLAMRLSPSIAILRTQSDERLVALARDGSEPAFSALVERYRRQVLRRCRRILPEARAEDATQQVFLAAWKALRRGDDVLDARAWLLRIAHNTALNGRRSPGYEYDELRESLRVTEAADAELERREVMRRTLTGLAGLPDRQREALLRTAVDGDSHADLARAMGLSEGATRQLVLRARTALRSAAAALVPAPLVSWAASAGGAGAGAIVAKVAAVAVVATTGAVAGPAVVHDVTGRGGDRAETARRDAPRPGTATPAATAAVAAAARAVDARYLATPAPGAADPTPAGATPGRSGGRRSGHHRQRAAASPAPVLTSAPKAEDQPHADDHGGPDDQPRPSEAQRDDRPTSGGSGHRGGGGGGDDASGHGPSPTSGSSEPEVADHVAHAEVEAPTEAEAEAEAPTPVPTPAATATEPADPSGEGADDGGGSGHGGHGGGD